MNNADNTKNKKSITLQDLECQEDLGLSGSGGGNVARIEAGGVRGYEGRIGGKNEQRVYSP